LQANFETRMSKININLPDGTSKQFESGVTSMQIAQSISEGLARNVLSAKVNGAVWDANREIEADATLNLLTWNDEEGKSTMWHSSAHLMAEALESLYPGIKFAIGPPIESGFYYDIDFMEYEFSEADLPKIEKKMIELARMKNVFERKYVSKPDAIKYFEEKSDQYKRELIQDLEDGEITFYTQGGFTDLCRGPHIPHTGFIKAVKLLSVAGAYWRGDENNPMLTRIYGITFPKQAELDDYLQLLEEAKKRDHRKLGKELELFTFDDDVGPGLPLWLPKGAFLIEQLEQLAKTTERKAGYQRVKTPHIAKENLYITSGHLPYYKDSMFPPMQMDGSTYYLKSMNCPHHHKLFDALPKSYKDLPVRFAEYGTCYRYEKSGELFGLMRVRALQMNDAHIYCTKDQFAQEFRAVNDMYLKYFKIFGIDKYIMRFSTHSPEKLGKKYVDNPKLWKETEDMVRKVLIESGIPYKEVADEAAFYGPKIDVQIYSVIGREFTLATNQVDFAQPLSFNLTFTNQNNESEHPIVIHRAPLGTHERFIGFLIEHYAGKFPLWLSPEQVRILPISEKFNEGCKNILQSLENYDIRASLDDRGEKIGKKIRDAEMAKVPYMLIIGEKELDEGIVSIRKQGEGDQGSKSVKEFAEFIQQDVNEIMSI
jgi:threonyl-tRNA synthetase